MGLTRRTWMAVALGVLSVASPVGARVLDLAVRDASHPRVAAPAYRGDAFCLRLREPAAAAVAHSTTARVSRLGLAAVDAAAARTGATFEPAFAGEPDGSPFAAFWLVHLPDDAALGDALDRFGALADVERADPIPIVPVTAVPNDSLWSSSFWFYQPPSRRDIHAPEAWDLTVGDTSIVVAIIDTGVLPYHPDLGGRVAGGTGQMWANWTERGGLPGVDDDHNGFVDDVAGWDFVNLKPDSDVRAGEDGYDADNDPNDFVGHGTNVAGIIGAIANNGSGIAGTAWNVRLMPLRVGWASNMAPTGEIDLAYAAQAVRYATLNRARIINCSFSSEAFLPLDAAAAAATRAGVLVVAAAGNNGSMNTLGTREDVLTVASIDRNDHVSRFSNTGFWVDIAAPGEDLATTSIARPGTDSIGVRQPAYTSEANGTSFAAPFVAGAAALVQSRRLALGRPLLSPMEMILHLRETTDDIAATNPTVTGFGTGRLDLARAVAIDPASRLARGGATTVGPGVTLTDDAGRTRVAFVTTDARYVVLDGTTADTLLDVGLPATPASGLAAADLGGGRGTALFVGLSDGRVHGMTPSGVALTGWPVTGRTLAQVFSSVALGDVDGDGVLEVVAVGSRDGVEVWHADGTPVPRFPQLGFEGVTRPVALSDLDGHPGVEILATSRDGRVHAIDGGGLELAGWPILAGDFIEASAPVVTRFGGEIEPTVLVTDGQWLRALRRDGTPRWRVALWNYDVRELALGDLTGDGSDEIVVSSGPYLAAFDSIGTILPGLWPLDDRLAATGDPVIGWCAAQPGIVVRGGLGLQGLDVAGRPLRGFPKPGFAGSAPTLADVDGDDATELVAGTGPDSLFYVYDLGPGTWRGAPQPWPTARANAARTGSRLYQPGVVVVDGSPPRAVTDLTIESAGTHQVVLRWSAPADPPDGAPAAAYDARRAYSFAVISDFATATPIEGEPAPGAPGSVEHLTVNGLIEGGTYFFALRSRDRTGNASALSNIVTITLQRVAPGAVADLALESIADTSATLRWTATGDDGATGRPRRYVLHVAPTPIDASNFGDAPIERVVPAAAPAGGEERATISGLPPGRRLWFALVAQDSAGDYSPISNVVVGTTVVGGPLSGRFGLALASGTQPVRTPVDLWWQAPDPAGARAIELFDLRGRRIRTLAVGPEAGGIAHWDGRDDQGSRMRPGLYFARLSNGAAQARARIVLLP